MLSWLLSYWPLVRAEVVTIRVGVPPSGSTIVESALERARKLAAELPDRNTTSTTGGEFEHHDWWQKNSRLFDDARKELGPLHSSLYDLEMHEEEFLQPGIRSAVEACELAAREGKHVPEDAVHALLQPAGPPGVWRLPIFTERFCTMLLEELNHHECSGIPLRRPNGMNRYGAILDELGLRDSLDYLTRRYLRPLGQMLYPWLVAHGDADEHYGFVVRYKVGEDVALSEHADASVVTLNVNLGIPGFRGGVLAFRGTRGLDDHPRDIEPSHVDFATFNVGEAILHLGGQYHAALPIESGERVNLVVWLHAKHEVVRFAPYDESDRLTAAQRWRTFQMEKSQPEWKWLFGHSEHDKSPVDGSMGPAEGSIDFEQEDAAAYQEL